MENKLIIKKCNDCGAIIKILNDCNCKNCGIKCCEKEMKPLVPNSEEASAEKHVPQIEKIEEEIFVK